MRAEDEDDIFAGALSHHSDAVEQSRREGIAHGEELGREEGEQLVGTTDVHSTYICSASLTDEVLSSSLVNRA